LGVSMVLELMSSGQIGAKDDPWPLLDAILRGKKTPPQKAYVADVKAVANTWNGLSEQRRRLLRLLSRFSLSAAQMRRWFDPAVRSKSTRSGIDDAGILDNPYRIAELDLGDEDYPVSISTVDR